MGVAMGVAGPAHADPDPSDVPAVPGAPGVPGTPGTPGAEMFLASLQAAGITYNRTDLVITTAETVCRMVGEGSSAPEVLRALEERNPGLTPERGGQFMAIAMRSYCPGQLAPGNPGG